MRRWNQSLVTLCLVTFSIAVVPVLGALSRDQHLDYDEDLARLCVIYSSAAYGRMTEWSFVNPACNEKTKGFVLSETYVGDGTDAFGYVGLDTVSERIVVAFKGTSDLRDWMTDLRTWVRYTKRCAPAGTPATASSSSRGTTATPRRGQQAAAAVDGGAISPALLSSPPPPPQEELRRPPPPTAPRGGGRGPRQQQRASQDDVKSGLAEPGSREEGGGGGVVGVESLGGGAAYEAELEDGAGTGGGGRRNRAESGGLGPEGDWLDVGEEREEGEELSAFEEEEQREMAASYPSGRRAGGVVEDRDNEARQGRPPWWQKMQHYVGGAWATSGQQQQQQQRRRRRREGGQEAESEQDEEIELLEELEEEEDGDDDDDDDPEEDELIGNVHFGFCEYYQTLVAEGLADAIVRLAQDKPSYSILVTGHSLGAAAAAVCAADLVQRLGIERDRVVLYTLGEPRTGDGIFAEGVNDRVGTSYRVVHNHDVVPHLALCCHGWFGKCKEGESSCPYQHSTEIVYANDMGEGAEWLMCNDSIGEDYACDPRSWDLSVSDHQHYFELPVGLYCASAPEDLTAFPLAQELDELYWAPYDAELRVLQGQGRQEGDEDDPFRPVEGRLRNA